MKKITLLFAGALVLAAVAVSCNDRGTDDTNNQNSAPTNENDYNNNRNEGTEDNNRGTQDNMNDGTEGGDDQTPNNNRTDSTGTSGKSSAKK
ncbi:MAG: hypothetical protein ACT4ON_04235 [Bacteroidota bacterium]